MWELEKDTIQHKTKEKRKISKAERALLRLNVENTAGV